MFSCEEDEFYISEQDILQAALELEPLTRSGKCANNQSSKRQSFELAENQFQPKQNVKPLGSTCTFSKLTHCTVPTSAIKMKDSRASPSRYKSSMNKLSETKSCISTITNSLASPISSATGKYMHKGRRKFPGPAGVLPKRQDDYSEDLQFVDQMPPKAGFKHTVNSQPSCQSGENLWLDGPWKMMKTELEHGVAELISTFNIASIVMKATKKQLFQGKVAATCVMIDSLSTHNCSDDISVGLKDPTGIMKGTIHRQLVKENSSYIIPGAVLVLKQVGVFSPSTRNHYLNITPNNVVRIYCREGQVGNKRLSLAQFNQEDIYNLKYYSPVNTTSNKSTAVPQRMHGDQSACIYRPTNVECKKSGNSPLCLANNKTSTKESRVTAMIQNSSSCSVPKRQKVPNISTSNNKMQTSQPEIDLKRKRSQVSASSDASKYVRHEKEKAGTTDKPENEIINGLLEGLEEEMLSEF